PRPSSASSSCSGSWGPDMPLKVLVVDDSSVIRRALAAVIESAPELTLVGTATNGRAGLEAIQRLEPDLVVLDVEMPEMNGLEVLEAMRRLRNRPYVFMFSSHTEHGTAMALKALSLGAIDCIPKPDGADVDANHALLRTELLPRLKAMVGRVAQRTVTGPNPRMPAGTPWTPPSTTAVARPVPAHAHAPRQTVPSLPPRTLTHERPAAAPLPRSAPSVQAPSTPLETRGSYDLKPIDVVTIAVSTGGPKALLEILPSIPEWFPVPILIVQHMPPTFTERLASLLGSHCRIPVSEAAAGQPVPTRGVLIAPGGMHLVVKRRERVIVTDTNSDPPENGCRPAADVLFRTAAAVYGSRVLGVVLTGMGSDGLAGTRALRAGGARVIVQDKATSIVWGMAGIVATEGLADEILPLGSIAEVMIRRANVGRSFAGRPS
ncbi:MAG: chemotaxis-specific protein-glutamate methyltransferase CheB, partial [Polyangiaceae bacterium]|nr:chemotaxis-specific protein-glutamate methyltransferase CheB [Polyangiaceae bacterium]